MEYRVLFWHTCQGVPYEFLKHCSEIKVDDDNPDFPYRTLELNKENYFDVMQTVLTEVCKTRQA